MKTNNKIPYDNPRALLAMEIPFPGALLLIRLLLLRKLRSLGITTVDTAILNVFEIVGADNSDTLLLQVDKTAEDNNVDMASACFYGNTDGEFAWLVYATAPAVARREMVALLCAALSNSVPPAAQKRANRLLKVLQKQI